MGVGVGGVWGGVGWGGGCVCVCGGGGGGGGGGQYDSGPKITYLTIVLQTGKPFSWVMIYNYANNTANLHKHIHYWRLNCGAAVNVLGYGEDKERVLILAPDSRFPLSSYILQPFSWLLINDDSYKPIKLHKRTYEWKPSCKAVVTIYKQKEEVKCTILGPRLMTSTNQTMIGNLTAVLTFWGTEKIENNYYS